MQITPINNNTINNRTNFKANIQPTKSLREGFDMLEKYSTSCLKKDTDSVKDFLDSLAKINDTEKITDFKIEIDKRRDGYTYTRINGRRVSGGHNENMSNIQDSYLTVEGVKKYASQLNESTQPSSLDFLRTQIEDIENQLSELKERYSTQIKAQFDQAKKMIFKDAE